MGISRSAAEGTRSQASEEMWCTRAVDQTYSMTTVRGDCRIDEGLDHVEASMLVSVCFLLLFPLLDSQVELECTWFKIVLVLVFE